MTLNHIEIYTLDAVLILLLSKNNKNTAESLL